MIAVRKIKKSRNELHKRRNSEFSIDETGTPIRYTNAARVIMERIKHMDVAVALTAGSTPFIMRLVNIKRRKPRRGVI